jgi:hypothetical protein
MQLETADGIVLKRRMVYFTIDGHQKVHRLEYDCLGGASNRGRRRFSSSLPSHAALPTPLLFDRSSICGHRPSAVGRQQQPNTPYQLNPHHTASLNSIIWLMGILTAGGLLRPSLSLPRAVQRSYLPISGS